MAHRVLTMMLVPPAVAAGISRNRKRMAGNLMVPNARPTKPPSIPTANEMKASKASCHAAGSNSIGCKS
jgi:hypothetical protein